MTEIEEAEDRVRDILPFLNLDELRVLAEVADRLRMGRSAYGRLDIKNDPRDWRREAAEESLDLAVYLAAELLRRQNA